MDDIQIRVEALSESLGQFLFIWHRQSRVLVYDVYNLNQTVAEVGPLARLVKERIHLCQLVFKPEVFYICYTKRGTS